MGRIKNTSRNTIYGLIYFAANLIFSFANRTIFVKILSESYLGLNNLFSNILSVLSVAELGLGGVLVFNMYKPIAENDTKKVASLLRAYKIVFFIVGTIVAVIGLALLPFLKVIIKDDVSDFSINIYLLFAIYILNSVIGYFFSYRRSIIFAHQRNDIETKSKFAYISVLNILQILVLIFTKNYTIYVAIMPIATAIDCIIISLVSKKKYPYPKGEPLDSETKKGIKKNVAAMLCHKIGGIIVFSTDSILISAFLGLTILGRYANYMLIIAALTSVINVLNTAVQASVGDSMAVNSVEQNQDLFRKLNFVFTWIIGWMSICCLCLFQHFIKIWLGDNYLLGMLPVVLLVVSFYITNNRLIVNIFKNANGLFIQDAYKPLVESVLNIVFSIGLCYLIGLSGIILGTILSSITFCIWIETRVLYKHYFRQNFLLYFRSYGLKTVVVLIAAALTFGICYFLPATGLIWFIFKLGICFIVPNLIFISCYFKTNEFKYLLTLLESFKRKLFPKKQIEFTQGIDSITKKEDEIKSEDQKKE